MMGRRSAQSLIEPIREVLLSDWNPIGFPVPKDEYESYIPGILKLLVEGTDSQRISDHLYTLETASLGLRGDWERDIRVGERLLSLMDDVRGT